MTVTHKIELPSNLDKVLQSCEVECVAGCCGLHAYAFAPAFICHAIQTHGTELVSAALREVEAQLSTIQSMPDNAMIDMGQLNDVLSREHAIEFFELLKKDIEDGLALGPDGWPGGYPIECESIPRRHFKTTHDRGVGF